jgi:hypothetical protein
MAQRTIQRPGACLSACNYSGDFRIMVAKDSYHFDKLG